MRNTPAYAGKTDSKTLLQREHEKHPRVCGEDESLTDDLTDKEETPPRMRGRRIKEITPGVANGNTPAYAGKTLRGMG